MHLAGMVFWTNIYPLDLQPFDITTINQQQKFQNGYGLDDKLRSSIVCKLPEMDVFDGR